VSGSVHIFADAGTLARAAAVEFARRAAAAVAGDGRFAVALSGGHTPLRLFAELADAPPEPIAWERVHVFWVDERTVPPDHPDSNFGAAQRALLGRVAIPAANVHRMRGEDPEPARAAAEYESVLRSAFAAPAPLVPRFDLVLLGMGREGHTASLFPGSEALGERSRLVAAPWVDAIGARRLTMTLPVLDAAACVLFLVAGADKAETVATVLERPPTSEPLPAQRVAPDGGALLWLLDAAAASLLSDRFRPIT
jgi:6-phosphogluconolactonase